MAGRRSTAQARDTREAIVDRAMAMASVQGLEGLTIGRLAAELEMSKAGVLNHFGNKEALQLAALQAAIDVFRRVVWEPASRLPAGRQRLLALCHGWLRYLGEPALPGGCFLTAAACEFDGRPGPVQEVVAGTVELWLGVLAREVEVAREAGELAPDADPELIAFQLNALAMGANQAVQLHGDPAGLQTARRAMHALLTPYSPGGTRAARSSGSPPRRRRARAG